MSFAVDAVPAPTVPAPPENASHLSASRHWGDRLGRLDRELREEPERLKESYGVRATRLEPVGIVYLWPVSG